MFALEISTGFIYPHVVALELTIRHINNSNFTTANFYQATMINVNINESTFTGADFRLTDMSYVDIDISTFTNADFR